MISIMGRYGIPVPDQTVESETILERPNQAGDGDGLEIEVHYGASCFAVNIYDSNMDIDVNPFVVVNNNIQGLDDQSELTPMNALARNSTKYIYINLHSGSLFSIFYSIIDSWIFQHLTISKSALRILFFSIYYGHYELRHEGGEWRIMEINPP